MFMYISIYVYIIVMIKEFYIKSKCWERKRGGGECSNLYKYFFSYFL